MLQRPPITPLFPYTTLFRSHTSRPRRIHDPRRSHEYRFSAPRSEEHTSELQSRGQLVCRLLLEKKKDHKKGQRGFAKQVRLVAVGQAASHDKGSGKYYGYG